LFALHGNSRKVFCGFAAAIFSIIMYGSPLSIMVSYVYTFYVNYSVSFVFLLSLSCHWNWNHVSSLIFSIENNIKNIYYLIFFINIIKIFDS
jgi:hypothetical protein